MDLEDVSATRGITFAKRLDSAANGEFEWLSARADGKENL